jgi:drug/metabolite transporter (DMT)-like permease
MKETKLSPALFWIIGFPFAALWASASVASKIGLTAAQPFTISFIRFSGAGLLMLVISHVFMQKQLPKGRQWKQLAVYGLLNISLYLGLFIIAIGEVSAGLGSLAVAINPVIITVALTIWDKQKLAFTKITSLLIGIIGVSICSFPLIVASHASVKGLIILFLSMSVYSIVKKTNGMDCICSPSTDGKQYLGHCLHFQHYCSPGKAIKIILIFLFGEQPYG